MKAYRLSFCAAAGSVFTALLLLGFGGCKEDGSSEAGVSAQGLEMDFSGEWLYHSYLNEAVDPINVTTRSEEENAAVALSALWAEGTMTLEADGTGGAVGKMTFLPGVELDVVLTRSTESVDGFAVTGTGIAGTATDGWEYLLRGWMVPSWQVAGDAERASAVGSVTNPVEIAATSTPLGTRGSFIMLKLDSE